MRGRNKEGHYQLFLLLILWICLLVMILIALINGAVSVPYGVIKDSFVSFDSENQLHQIIQTIRLPRVLGAAIVGASLAVSGAIAQGITKNPLADSGLLGINSGAGLGLAVSFAFSPRANYYSILGSSFLGAALSISIIYYISNHSVRGATPLRLTLVGSGISALFLSFSQLIAIQFNLNQELAFWTVGGVSIISWTQLKIIFFPFLFAMMLAVLYGSSITVLRFGDDAAISLGKKPQQIRLVGSLIILILSGLSVAIVGSVSFVGLIVPHMMRKFVGDNYRKLIPFVAVGGALLVVTADLIGRMIHPPFETPFGIIIAIIGVPIFIYLFRKGGNMG